MKARDAQLRLRRFDLEEKSRKVEGLEQMIREFHQMALDLERQVQAEEDRTGVKDPAHFAYSMFAKAAKQRREKLVASIADLRLKLEDAARERDEVLADLESEPAEPREFTRPRRRSERATAA